MKIEVIQSKIYEIRGVRVMLDFDLAEMYGVTTGNLNKAVKRNIVRFPERFMFRLTNEEYSNLVFQNGISRWGGSRYLPFAFTEQGTSMLSSVLRSEVAIQVSISIMDAFVSMRHLLSNSRNDKVEKLQDDVIQLKKYLEETFKDYNDINEETRKELDNIYLAIAALSVKQPSKPRNPIGFIKPIK